jgi:glycosyltransferase involved in cell wall biosynthesis
MRVLQVNFGDVIGSRFNNFGIRHLLAEEGIAVTHLVWKQLSNDPEVAPIFAYPGSRFLNRKLDALERELSIHSVLQLHSFALPMQRAFRRADLVHYHLIHDGYFSILALPFLSRLKPSVWTWHDPWTMSGHCIYPLECQRWRIGCGECPQLDLPFAVKRDRTAFNFRQKKWVYDHMDIDVVVASKYMLDRAKLSPLATNIRLHHIPFGIDLAHFRPRPSEPARKRLGVFEGRIVIGVRAFDSPFKGYEFFLDALAQLPTNLQLCIITTHGKGDLNRYIGRHQIIELGWVDDEQVLLDYFMASDLFVMPSTAEAFGLMAVEAMACSKPVIVFDGTALPEVSFAPEVGVAVPLRDAKALAAVIARLSLDPNERRVRGERGRAAAERHYDARQCAERLATLYRSVAARRQFGDTTMEAAL